MLSIFYVCSVPSALTAVSHQLYLDSNMYTILEDLRVFHFVIFHLLNDFFCYKSIQMWNSLSLEVREASYSDFVSYILLHIYCICYRVCCCSCYCKYSYALWIVMCVCLYLLQGRTAIADCLEFKSSIISATDILTQLSVEHKCWAKQF